MRTLTHTLALTRVPGLLTDRHFRWAILVALPVWLLLWGWPGMPTAPTPRLWPAFYLVILSPLVEELAFRGALQGWCLDYPWGRGRSGGVSHANLVVTGLFCAAHFAHHPPLWAVAVALPSLVFGHLRERHGSVVPGVLVHGWYNAGYLVAISLP